MVTVRSIGPKAAPGSSSTCVRRLAIFGESLRRFLREYLLEWRLTDRAIASDLEMRVAAIEAAINGSDVVCFVKPGGLCPFCNLATRIFEEQLTQNKFGLHIADLLYEDREALKVAMRVPMLTWPVVFIRGSLVAGGGEAVATMHKQNGLAEAIGAEKAVFAAPRPLPSEAHPRPLLLQQAGGGSWLGCQTRIYGNVLRGIALLQIALLAPAHVMSNRGVYAVSIPIQLLLAIDAFFFCLFGPTPLAPLGSLATLLVWHRRGTVAPLLPYKITFAGLYFLMNAIAVGCQLDATGLGTGGSGGNGTETSSENGPLCSLVQSDGLVYTMLSNSAFLAIFRF